MIYYSVFYELLYLSTIIIGKYTGAMHQLTIYRRDDLPKIGATVHREAVRAIIFRGRKLALLETVQGDIKFPGWGIEAGESLQQNAPFFWVKRALAVLKLLSH